ncbi:unnamed protein product [Adineta ricciae]|uniref:BTB domain-containing protein n=1 Tax=Adineta ricciae TaxID=249248 RepID=A0A815QNQ9_ADIRI|nr:unnamed protein product [Adineta ricciae]CAF1565956.1 unnamed protein product [Adineta ricciae]
MSDDTLQSSQSKESNTQRKLVRLKQNLPKRRRRNLVLPINHRRSILKNILIRNGDSLIHVSAFDHHLRSNKDQNSNEQNIITINVSGNRYQTHLSTLENYPNTLLGNKQKRHYYWNDENKEYFFDRHRACFEAILYYYQSNGRLRRPDYVPLDTFLEEVSFFDLGPNALSQINKMENVSIVKYIDLPNLLWRRYIWFYMEYPQHSMFAKILYFFSMIITVLSCLELAIETLPEYNDKWNNLCSNETNYTYPENNIPICWTVFSSPFFIIQSVCVFYFTIEFLLRLISTPSYYRFVLSIYNWIDLAAIVPYFVFLGLALSHKASDLNGSSFVGLRLLRILRFLRVFKFYLVFRQLKSLRVLSSTLKESFVDFVILIVILTLVGFLFGSAVYFVEQEENGQVFDSIPKAIFWGIITITTVGYGDMYPVTVAGRILTCMCAFFGVAISGMLVSVLVGRYQRVYNRKMFFPEQILSAIDESSTEQDEKQEFINKRLSKVPRKTVFSTIIPPVTPRPSVVSSIDYKNYLDSKKLSSYKIQFVISIYESQGKSLDNYSMDLMEELKEIVHNRDLNIHLKLINPRANFPDKSPILTSDKLPHISEE